MNVPWGELLIAANTTIQSALLAGSDVANYSASAVSKHGEASVSGSTSTGKFTCKPGTYFVQFNASVEAPETSGALTSGDSTGEVAAVLYVAGAAVTGAKATIEQDTAGVAKQIVVSKVVEITEAQLAAGTNLIHMVLIGESTAGNDVLIKEGQFHVLRLN